MQILREPGESWGGSTVSPEFSLKDCSRGYERDENLN